MIVKIIYIKRCLQIETWKDITGYEGLYQISSHGNVRSLERYVRQKTGKEGKIYNRRVNKNDNIFKTKHRSGYLFVHLVKNGISKNKFCHRLVAEHFLDQQIDNKLEVNHKDFDKTNNYYKNLEWVTRKENMEHYFVNNKPKNKFFCVDCSCEISRNSTRCEMCDKENKRSRSIVNLKNKINREELKFLIRNETFVSIGIKYNVTDNAIRQWCNKFNLPTSKNKIKRYTDKEWELL